MASEVLHRLWHEKFSAGAADAADAADAAGDCIARLLSEVPHDVLAECPLPILFLYMKNVLADEDVEDRVRAVCRIATGPGPSPSSSPSRKWTVAHLRHQRLMALVRNMNGDVTWDGPGSGPAPPELEGLQLWEGFAAHHPEWCSPEAHVFFVNTPALRQRVQSGGASFMHAPSVLVHYLCSQCGGAPAMPDLTTLKLQHYDADALWRFVHDNHGGVASEFLYRLCSAPTTELQRARVTADNIVRHLDMYGPALASFVFHGSLPNHGTAESPMTCHGEPCCVDCRTPHLCRRLGALFAPELVAGETVFHLRRAFFAGSQCQTRVGHVGGPTS